MVNLLSKTEFFEHIRESLAGFQKIPATMAKGQRPNCLICNKKILHGSKYFRYAGIGNRSSDKYFIHKKCDRELNEKDHSKRKSWVLERLEDLMRARDGEVL